ncbi:putative phage abortive infection protein [Aliarcobacter butzleri]
MNKYLKANYILKFAISIAIIIIPLSILFLWQESFTLNEKISHDKFGTFGDFFGGIVGSIWSLCGIVLFYLALKSQRKDFKNNRKAVKKQIESLSVQIEEFKLQKDELKETREVFIEQSKTLKQQRFESTFFSLLDLYNKIILNFNQNNKDFFKNLRIEFNNPINNSTKITHEMALEHYVDIFYKNKDELNSYFRTIYRILSFIENSNLDEKEKFSYVKILRALLSENELLFIYYNAETKNGKKFYPIILKYNLLKHLTPLSKLEFKYFEKLSNINNIHQFNNDIFELINSFFEKLNIRIIEDENFDKHEISIEYDNKNIVIKLISSDINNIQVNFYLLKDNKMILDNDIILFQDYFKNLLHDYLIFSRYNKLDNFQIISEIKEDSEKYLSFEVESKVKITINNDYKE